MKSRFCLPMQILVGAVPGPGLNSQGSSRTLRSAAGGDRNILAAAMLSIANSTRAKAHSAEAALPANDKWRSWQGASYTEFLPPNGAAVAAVCLLA